MIIPICDNCVARLGPLEQKTIGRLTLRSCVGCNTVHHVHAYNDQTLLSAIERTRTQLQSLAAAVSIYVEEVSAKERARGHG
jgi:hypothetical protein